MEFEVNGGKNGEIPWEKGRILLRGFIKEAFKALIITWIPAFAGMTRMGACSAEVSEVKSQEGKSQDGHNFSTETQK
jgi:hypothetical protein